MTGIFQTSDPSIYRWCCVDDKYVKSSYRPIGCSKSLVQWQFVQYLANNSLIWINPHTDHSIIPRQAYTDEHDE